MPDAVNLLVETHAAAVWVLPVVAALTALDGFFPPVPSESVMVALAAIDVSVYGPNLALPGGPLAAAAVGVAVAVALGVLVDHLLRRGVAPLTGSSIRPPGAP